MFRRILIANRGEVVSRVLRTTRRLGIEAVVVVSEADRDAPYVEEADEVVCLGPPPSSQSYLDRSSVVQAAKQTRCAAVHPGWGFLAEDPLFADLCRQHGLSLVGPSARLMRLMGKKLSAKQAARAAGLDVIPGSDGLLHTLEEARAAAEATGYPLLLKADSGGGGRGMRRCDGPEDLERAFGLARSESLAAFGDGALYMERFIEGGRHIEVQVFGDAYGNALHLGERECSIQRKHQKLIEESPSPALDEAARTEAGLRAARAAARLGYVGAGTIEFLLDEEGALRFMEMNTRLQVEHPITEERCGIDLVEWQLRVAAGEPLPLDQSQVRLSGHAIEARINAEDPSADFRPCPGTIERLEVPAGLRFDTHVRAGYTVPPHYDSLLGKLIAYADDRPTCIAALRAGLEALRIDGVATTRSALLAVLDSEAFRSGRYDTRGLPGIEGC
ncbi:MAG: ATP-grasp domain-containing protein [Planctomycetota bacterium]|nr:MAG: ATP-grasp domain-containing protein [Planctomycetota bacterium]